VLALTLAFTSCKKDDSLEGLMSKPETSVSSAASPVSSSPIVNPTGSDSVSNGSCRCPLPENSN